MGSELGAVPELLAWLREHKESIQTLSWLVASIGGVFAALMALVQLQESRRWKKTELAKEIVKEIWENDKSVAAMILVDWSNREFKLDSGSSVRITRDDVVDALRTDTSKPFTEKEIFVRDCYDNLLDALQALEHYIDRRLIAFEDVEYPLEYAVCELVGIRQSIEAYISAYEFRNAAQFLGRYERWRSAESRGRDPCVAAAVAGASTTAPALSD